MNMAVERVSQSADKQEIFRRLPLMTESVHRLLSVSG